MVAPELRARAGEAVVPLLKRNLSAILAGTLTFEQQDSTQATFTRKLCKEDGAIDFDLSAEEIDRRLRAFVPWPGGYFDHGEKRIKVGQSSVAPSEQGSDQLPGTIVSAGSALEVATKKGIISFHELQQPGGRMLPVADFLRGYPIAPGERLIGGVAKPLIASGD